MAIEFLDSPFFTSKADEGFLENIKQGDIQGYYQNLGEALRDEFVGIDDYRRAMNYMSEGNFLKALKSYLAGNLELASSVASFVPGGILLKGATKLPMLGKMLSKGGKFSKAAKGLKVLAPLTKEEQMLARVARARGVKPSLFRAPAAGPTPQQLIGSTIDVSTPARQGRFAQVVGQLPSPARRVVEFARPKEIGMSRGGYAGSFARGLAQFAGALPMAQGPLANRAYMARAAGQVPSRFARIGEGLSGRLGIPLQREGRDELAELLPGVGGIEPIDPLDQAILEILYGSPGAAY